RPARGARGAARTGRGDRGRPGGRGPHRRVALQHRGGASAGRRRRRAHSGPGSGAARAGARPVSWQAAAIAVLLVALAAGFGWYERSRPPSRVLALVASLAALAVVGRLVFAPLPNVKPATTDVILFAGYALGSAPGFATGAIAAFVSNFFFEQGAWTPWQMAAWAGVGVGGGVLARVAGRELGRWPLAVACGLAGLGFGAVMDTFQWTLPARQDVPGSDQANTGWAALGIAAAGHSPNAPGHAGRSAVDYMRAHASGLQDVGDLERTILALRAGGVSPRHFAGRDLVAELLARQRGDGSFDGLVNHAAFGVLALRAAGVSGGPVHAATSWVGRQQGSDGGVRFAPHV